MANQQNEGGPLAGIKPYRFPMERVPAERVGPAVEKLKNAKKGNSGREFDEASEGVEFQKRTKSTFYITLKRAVDRLR